MKSERHWHATINYIHHNPVNHGYVHLWQDWPLFSAAAFLQQIGRDEAEALWKEYPIGEYGRGWDDYMLELGLQPVPQRPRPPLSIKNFNVLNLFKPQTG